MAGDSHQGGPTAAFRDQTVEISLAKKFPQKQFHERPDRHGRDRRGNTLGPASPGTPKPLRKPHTPRVVELLRKAIELRRELDAGKVQNQAEIARREAICRARVTQIRKAAFLVMRSPSTQTGPKWFRIASARMLRAALPVQRKRTSYALPPIPDLTAVR